jgi:hypothetical protein
MPWAVGQWVRVQQSTDEERGIGAAVVANGEDVLRNAQGSGWDTTSNDGDMAAAAVAEARGRQDRGRGRERGPDSRGRVEFYGLRYCRPREVCGVGGHAQGAERRWGGRGARAESAERRWRQSTLMP